MSHFTPETTIVVRITYCTFHVFGYNASSWCYTHFFSSTIAWMNVLATSISHVIIFELRNIRRILLSNFYQQKPVCALYVLKQSQSTHQSLGFQLSCSAYIECGSNCLSTKSENNGISKKSKAPCFIYFSQLTLVL